MERKIPFRVNNTYYDTLKEEWLAKKNHPLVLLAAENQLRNPWIHHVLQKERRPVKRVLDIGCGGGFLTHYLSEKGYEVSGIDSSAPTIEWLCKKQTAVDYQVAKGEKLPFLSETFDAVCAMDVLEHVPQPEKVIDEASRVLKPGGIFFFHTFPRNPLTYALVIQLMEKWVPKTPKNLHRYENFIDVREMNHFLKKADLLPIEYRGVVPRWNWKSFYDLVVKREVDHRLSFRFSKSLKLGYCGFARKQNSSAFDLFSE